MNVFISVNDGGSTAEYSVLRDTPNFGIPRLFDISRSDSDPHAKLLTNIVSLLSEITIGTSSMSFFIYSNDSGDDSSDEAVTTKEEKILRSCIFPTSSQGFSVSTFFHYPRSLNSSTPSSNITRNWATSISSESAAELPGTGNFFLKNNLF
ncbi:uncharacterized protein LOC112126632 isoform X1 [Cimex lectularius]|uniref:Uncharacterized protein n=1 Tax=Cimex lectularius TaxID=79782 RepID=A0A8I6SF04_CIMLE|nr:uncharacterized protein LOC112126632 isoform X1 [Cimex lectularius]